MNGIPVNIKANSAQVMGEVKGVLDALGRKHVSIVSGPNVFKLDPEVFPFLEPNDMVLVVVSVVKIAEEKQFLAPEIPLIGGAR